MRLKSKFNSIGSPDVNIDAQKNQQKFWKLVFLLCLFLLSFYVGGYESTHTFLNRTLTKSKRELTISKAKGGRTVS